MMRYFELILNHKQERGKDYVYQGNNNLERKSNKHDDSMVVTGTEELLFWVMQWSFAQ